MNPRIQATILVELVCQSYGIEPSDLFKRAKYQVVKKVKNVHATTIRYCLSHYLYVHTPLIQYDIMSLLGYKDRSMVSRNMVIVKNYLEVNDQITRECYDRIEECAKMMQFKSRVA